MDVLRHTGRAELASFLGGSNAGADASQWGFAPYTEADLEKQLGAGAAALRRGRPAGGRRRAELRRRDQRLHRRRQRQPDAEAGRVHAAGQADGTVEADRRDRDRLADRRHLRPRRRQRAGLGADDAGLRRRAMGAQGRAARPGSASAPRTTPKRRRRSPSRFPYETRSAFAKRGLALPDRGTRPRNRRPPRERPRRRRRRSRRAARRPADRAGAARKPGTPRTGSWSPPSTRRRPPDRGDGPAGRLLRPADPDGGGPARPRHRRPRRLLRRRQPVRRARPRPRLRLERDHADLRQRRHLRRGPLQGRLPLPLPRQVHADGKAGQDRELDAERDRLDRGRLADADRLPDRARDRLRPRQGARQEGRLRPPAQHLLPRGRLGDRLRAAERTRLRAPGRRQFKKAVSNINFLFNWAYVDSKHIAYALSGAMPQRAKGTSPDFPILGTGQYDWKGFNPATQTADYLPFSKHPQAVDPPLPRLLEQQAGAGLGGGRRQVRLRADLPLADDRRQGPGGDQGQARR